MVFYFTGTGNSLYIAKQIEKDPISIPQIMHEDDLNFTADSIGVVAPVYGHTAPMLIGTFLESFDLDGKEIYPFSQSASMDTEQFANSMAFVQENAAGANIHEGLFVSASNTEGIQEYLTANGFAK